MVGCHLTFYDVYLAGLFRAHPGLIPAVFLMVVVWRGMVTVWHPTAAVMMTVSWGMLGRLPSRGMMGLPSRGMMGLPSWSMMGLAWCMMGLPWGMMGSVWVSVEDAVVRVRHGMMSVRTVVVRGAGDHGVVTVGTGTGYHGNRGTAAGLVLDGSCRKTMEE